MSNNAIGKSWSDVRNQLFTPDEIAESDLRVALIGELIKARQEILKVLAPLGKTLAIVPLQTAENKS